MFWGPINTSGSEGTVIVPATSNYPIGSSGFASKCSVYPVRYVELPLDIQEKVQGFISREVTKLGRTGARNFIYGVCTDSERTAPLYRVFDKELVNEVVGITRRALDSSR